MVGREGRLRVGSKKMKSEHDRNRHARSRSKQPRNTIFLQGGTERESGPRRSASRGKAPTIGSATSRLGSRAHPRSLVRMRPVLASNDRNGFIVEARRTKKVNNDRMGRRVADPLAKNACRSSQIAVVMEQILSSVCTSIVAVSFRRNSFFYLILRLIYLVTFARTKKFFDFMISNFFNVVVIDYCSGALNGRFAISSVARRKSSNRRIIPLLLFIPTSYLPSIVLLFSRVG